MDNPQAPNSPERPTRRHTIDVNPDSTVPRYDFILPSYSRDRRRPSITTTVPPGMVINNGPGNINIPIPEPSSTSAELENKTDGVVIL